MRVAQDTFDPVSYSLMECQFLLDHLGEPSFQALQGAHPEIAPSTVKPIIDRVYELIDLEKRGVLSWVGVDAIKTSINIYLEQQAKWMDRKSVV